MVQKSVQSLLYLYICGMVYGPAHFRTPKVYDIFYYKSHIYFIIPQLHTKNTLFYYIVKNKLIHCVYTYFKPSIYF